ncbi:hypothetical protein E2C01_080284 [Portunus trituberculatus]|uniref:Uncharacterized protein n=1 Tax=Portunus trituberculatus TaxID=210409 RepID=A0A5B7IST1_PORTR|nr:hypothetical protein [Portunus trituberculatus]
MLEHSPSASPSLVLHIPTFLSPVSTSLPPPHPPPGPRNVRRCVPNFNPPPRPSHVILSSAPKPPTPHCTLLDDSGALTLAELS